MYEVKVYNWEAASLCQSNDLSLAVGESVIVETSFGKEIGVIEEIRKNIEKVTADCSKDCDNGCKKVECQLVRKANIRDIVASKKYNSKRKEARKFFRSVAVRYNLPMKLVDVHFGFEGSHIIFAFICETKVDFREMVKDLSRKFQKSVRLQQVGSRDNAKQYDCYGICGRELCCRLIKGNLGGINTTMAKVQNLEHRSSERISGVCGRLMCCLAFESKSYEEADIAMPQLGSEVTLVSGEKGKVVRRFLMKQLVEVELPNESRVKVSLNGLKK